MPTLEKLSVEDVRNRLQLFEHSAFGDKDGHIEYTELSPYPLASKIHYYTQFFAHSPNGGFEEGPSFSALSSQQQENTRAISRLWLTLEELRKDLFRKQATPQQQLELAHALKLQCLKVTQTDALVAACAKEVATAQDPHQLTPEMIREFISVLWKLLDQMYDETVLYGREKAEDQPIVILGDSLTMGMQFAAVPAASVLPPISHYVLRKFGVRDEEISVIGFKDAYPFDGRAMMEGNQGMGTTVLELAYKLPFSHTPEHFNAQRGKYHSRVVIAGAPGATTHDALIDPSGDTHWQSPGRLVIQHLSSLFPREQWQQEHKKPSLMQYVLDEFELRLREMESRGKKGGVLAVALGSNNMLAFNHYVLN